MKPLDIATVQGLHRAHGELLCRGSQITDSAASGATGSISAEVATPHAGLLARADAHRDAGGRHHVDRGAGIRACGGHVDRRRADRDDRHRSHRDIVVRVVAARDETAGQDREGQDQEDALVHAHPIGAGPGWDMAVDQIVTRSSDRLATLSWILSSGFASLRCHGTADQP